MVLQRIVQEIFTRAVCVKRANSPRLFAPVVPPRGNRLGRVVDNPATHPGERLPQRNAASHAPTCVRPLLGKSKDEKPTAPSAPFGLVIGRKIPQLLTPELLGIEALKYPLLCPVTPPEA